MLFTGPQGMAAATSTSIHSAQLRSAITSNTRGRISSRFATRSGLDSKRGSSSHSSCPTARQKLTHSFWLATAMAIGRSRVGKTW